MTFMVRKQVIFNLDENKIGFVPSACSYVEPLVMNTNEPNTIVVDPEPSSSNSSDGGSVSNNGAESPPEEPTPQNETTEPSQSPNTTDSEPTGKTTDEKNTNSKEDPKGINNTEVKANETEDNANNGGDLKEANETEVTPNETDTNKEGARREDAAAWAIVAIGVGVVVVAVLVVLLVACIKRRKVPKQPYFTMDVNNPQAVAHEARISEASKDESKPEPVVSIKIDTDN
eukprot:TRINITY_DN4320_c0_g4_i1.p2 TRINITY_DN4320_c0_g4~~TRINITY_DN4320_c0_g4_i1.p2  ORF type:complete len:230 (-),score=40.08 TRINITY_DN4320_c0_g4_i1:1044-1733(-)